MKLVDAHTLINFEKLMNPGVTQELRKAAAISLLRLLPVIDTIEIGDTILEERLIGKFNRNVQKRSMPELRIIGNVRGLLQYLLTDEQNSPSTTFDPNGKATITHRQDLLK